MCTYITLFRVFSKNLTDEIFSAKMVRFFSRQDKYEGCQANVLKKKPRFRNFKEKNFFLIA